MAIIVLAMLLRAVASDGSEMVSSEKAKMVPVFAEAWLSDEMSVGIYSPPEMTDFESYWRTDEHRAEKKEMTKRGYYPLHLREKLKGDPPELIYHNHVMVVCGHKPSRPLFIFSGARMVFVLRRFLPGDDAQDDLLFPTSASEDTNEPYMAEGGYAGVGCLEWPTKEQRREKLWTEMPNWFVRISADEIEDFRHCGEWCAGDESKAPLTPWGQELQKWARKKRSAQ